MSDTDHHRWFEAACRASELVAGITVWANAEFNRLNPIPANQALHQIRHLLDDYYADRARTSLGCLKESQS